MTLLFSTHQEAHLQQQKIFICPELRQATTPKHFSPLQEGAAHIPGTKEEADKGGQCKMSILHNATFGIFKSSCGNRRWFERVGFFQFNPRFL